jgi:replicative DNA helicase
MSLKGALYCFEVLMGLQLHGVGKRAFDERLAKSGSPRQVELVILKNRNGNSGKIICYDYHAKYSCFEEKELPFQDAGSGASAEAKSAAAECGPKTAKTASRKKAGW